MPGHTRSTCWCARCAALATLEQALRAALLSLPVPERYPPLTLSPQRQKQQTQKALVAWLLAEAAQRSVLAIWEDLHWADPSALELLGLLLDQAPTARLLLVLTCRPTRQRALGLSGSQQSLHQGPRAAQDAARHAFL